MNVAYRMLCVALCPLMFALTSCRNSGASEGSESETETVLAAGAKWPSSQISTCWEFTSPDTASFRSQVQSTVAQAFAKTKLRFNGWKQCPPVSTKIDMRIFIYDDRGSAKNADYQQLRSTLSREPWKGHPRVRAWGQKMAGKRAGIVLSISGEDAAPQLVDILEKSSLMGRANLAISSSLHEFGHAIGLRHEDAHPDNRCKPFDEEMEPGDRAFGPWNKGSFMERCFYRNFDYDKGIVWPNQLDIDGINKIYTR